MNRRREDQDCGPKLIRYATDPGSDSKSGGQYGGKDGAPRVNHSAGFFINSGRVNHHQVATSALRDFAVLTGSSGVVAQVMMLLSNDQTIASADPARIQTALRGLLCGELGVEKFLTEGCDRNLAHATHCLRVALGALMSISRSSKLGNELIARLPEPSADELEIQKRLSGN